ncbi:MAG: hypothetical protein DRJ42_18380 [Deltaproteobacteria bacterium]|nr:MAG: hypothetical protein DRJ42_18380 [Deltaproteobacteria bacterium]
MLAIKRLAGAAALMLPALLAASCSAITNPGQYVFFEGGCPLGSDESDLQVELFNFEAHEDKRIEVRLIRDGEFVLRAVLEGIDPIGTEEGNADTSLDLCLTFSDALDFAGSYQVHTFVDCAEEESVPCGNGDFEPPGEDGWLSGVQDGYAEVDGSIAPTGFDDPASFPPGDFQLDVRGMHVHAVGTQHFALNVIDPLGNVVGFARVPKIVEPDFTVFIQEVLQPDTDYTVEMYADFVKNGIYDPIIAGGGSGDHSWIKSFRSNGEGMIIESWDHDTNFEDLDSFTF